MSNNRKGQGFLLVEITTYRLLTKKILNRKEALLVKGCFPAPMIEGKCVSGRGGGHSDNMANQISAPSGKK
jgi:hypothetical protein